MGRLEVHIRHGHTRGPAQWGAVVALVVFVLFAAAGHREIGTMLHEVLAVVEIAAFSLVALAALAIATLITIRVRRANRAGRDLDRACDVLARHYGASLTGDEVRAALDQSRPDTSGYLTGHVVRDDQRNPF
jgi:hypothetical protein